jgi:hypothetical protein
MSVNRSTLLKTYYIMKNTKRQNEFIFAVAAIFLTILFLVILFYVKASNADAFSELGENEYASYIQSKKEIKGSQLFVGGMF